MSRSSLFRQLARSMRIGKFCNERNLSTQDGIAEYRRLEEAHRAQTLKRRELLTSMGKLAAAGAVVAATQPLSKAFAAPPSPATPSIAIIGAGLAGLSCADTLATSGIAATIHEASNRAGGRCHTYGTAFGAPTDLFPGQVAERGGEFIDNLHKYMLGYAQRFGLAKEDVTKVPGDIFYYFNGVHYPESVVVEQYRQLVDSMHVDLRTLSGAASADSHNAGDVTFDYMDIETYLNTRNAGPVIKAAVIEAYEAEYGLEAWQQSALNFLLFIHADKRSKFTPFGVYSDERWHITDGNQKIVQGLASSIPGPIRYGEKLVAAKKNSAGDVVLTFDTPGGTRTFTYDAVVISIPFTVLRGVQLDRSLGFPQWKTDAINKLGYGMNAKMMIGFKGKYWEGLGNNGTLYSNQPNVQTTWETNPTRATHQYAILTDYSSGSRGKNLRPGAVQTEASKFIADLDKSLPGASANVRRDSSGKIVAHLEHWPSNPLTLGSYTCYTPGQFTTLCGNEGKPVGNVYFAGEHANSFYVWQGFMEGAVYSGIDAANMVLEDIKWGRLFA